MLKTPVNLSVVLSLLAVNLVLGLILGIVLGATVFATHGSTATAPVRIIKVAPLTKVTIPLSQEIFEPFILAVQLNATVIWQNNDSVAHVFTTTPDQSDFLNPQSFALNVEAGKDVTFKFTQPGLYHYYENTMATWNKADARVAAHRGVPNFPLAMDGVIWVRGPIIGLPSASTNRIPPKHDDFVNEFVAINPGSVSWHNFDTDPHFVALAPGWSAPTNPSQSDINPADIGINRIAGTADVPGGDTITVIFNKPGLYYYYCPNHARIEAITHRAQAFKLASEYPIPMEGFILVVGS